MKTTRPDIPDVGAPDPELRTSPIADDDADESLDAELETGACYFEYVRSGDEVLRCAGRGVWVRAGELEP
jgi:hypothetical protein